MRLDQTKIVSKMVRGLVNYIAQKGYSRDDLLWKLGLNEEDLNNPDFFFSASLYNRIYELGEDITGDANLGLAFGAESTPDVGSDLGLMASTCETVADVLRYQLRYSSLVRNFDHFELATIGDELIISWTSEVPVSTHVVEEVFARRTSFINKYVLNSGNDVFIQINFRHSLNGRDIKCFESVFGCRVLFDQPFDQIICNKSSLSLSLITPDRDLCEFYEGLARKKLVAQTQVGIVEKVSQILVNALPNVLSLDHVSDNLSLSPRTLQRQLQKHGYTLKDLYTEVKRNVALDSLKAGQSLMTISLKLGFSEQSAFQRAFKRWQGCTPKEFQQLYLNNSCPK